eukprot:TRINITY_DN12482_c0_g1_i22.p1 TRINITY_DN12482_c0_g1~~TRINITY_DN12482_c0_g1_i22.p1  ORF type:complete len:354 (-),score=94.42 TRINITY_DN12482_c0_g1_i22:422-1483(-)
MLFIFFFFFKQKTAYEMLRSLVGSEMCIRDRYGMTRFVTMRKALLRLGPAAAAISLSRAACEDKPSITADNIREFHRIKMMLRGCTSMEDAIRLEGVQWDFKNKCAIPGRIWVSNTPEDLKEQVSRPLNAEELRLARRMCNVTAPREVPNPRVLIVLGVAAAGKSTITAKIETLFDIKLKDYVAVEGDALREAHKGWTDAISRDTSLGYIDMFDKHLKVHTKKLKNDILEEALLNHQNVLWPVVAKDTESMMALVNKFKAHGYGIDLVGLVVGPTEAAARSMNRAHQIGRWNRASEQGWENTYSTLVELCRQEFGIDRVVVYDNQDFGNVKLLYARTNTIQDLQQSVARRRLE